jgi:hypothetical protein
MHSVLVYMRKALLVAIIIRPTAALMTCRDRRPETVILAVADEPEAAFDPFAVITHHSLLHNNNDCSVLHLYI